MNIHKGISKALDFLIISLADITFWLVSHFNENAHESWKAPIDKYEVSYEKQEILNKVTNRWNICNIKNSIQDTDKWFNEVFNSNLKLKKIKGNTRNMKIKLKDTF